MDLERKNAHPRDSRISFEADGHIYRVDGDPEYRSVTTVIGDYFEHFDSKVAIEKMRTGRNWNEKHYLYGKTDEQIEEIWEKNRVSAAASGTEMHDKIEKFLNGENPNWTGFEKEKTLFLEFTRQFPDLEIYRTEWKIFSTKYRVAGALDAVYKNEKGDLVLVDWKRSKKVERSNKYKSGLRCLSHLDDCNVVKYSLQLNTYRAIFESNYNLKISKMMIVFLHPSQKSPIVVEAPKMNREMKAIFKDRLTEI